MTERDRLDLRGLLPPNVMSTEQQIERFSESFNFFFFLMHLFLLTSQAVMLALGFCSLLSILNRVSLPIPSDREPLDAV